MKVELSKEELELIHRSVVAMEHKYLHLKLDYLLEKDEEKASICDIKKNKYNELYYKIYELLKEEK